MGAGPAGPADDLLQSDVVPEGLHHVDLRDVLRIQPLGAGRRHEQNPEAALHLRRGGVRVELVERGNYVGSVSDGRRG